MARRAVLSGWLLLLCIASGLGAGEGLVALSTADASCDDGSGDRYVDCANGTVTDTDTGLVWLKDASCYEQLVWSDAMLTVAGLSDGRCGLSDGSSPGDWRLPSIGEWAATVAAAIALGCPPPTLTDDTGLNCLAAGTSFTDIAAGTPVYWSATTNEAAPGNALTVSLTDGGTTTQFSKLITSFVWPVRFGQ